MIARVAKGTFGALIDGGKAASSGLISTLSALAAWPPRASTITPKLKRNNLITIPRKTDRFVAPDSNANSLAIKCKEVFIFVSLRRPQI